MPNKTTTPGKRPAQKSVLAAICLACGILNTAAPAATDKSGVIEDETWTLAMSPIRVVGDISVYSLTIEPGVEVLFTGNFEFDCPGVLHAAGGATNKIWFHRADGTVPSPWPWPTPVPTSWPWPSRLSGSSHCKDAGDPDPSYNDLCFYDATTTPWGSLGTARNDMGAYGGPGACLWEPGSGSLKVLAPTGGGQFGVGDNVTLTVQASGIGPFTYVWKKGGEVITDIPGHFTGANSANLTITAATAADAGNYTVEVTNALGDKVTSAVAAVAVDPLRVNVKMFAGLIIQADAGKTVRIEYSNDLSSGSWTTLTELVLPISPYSYYDTDSPNHPRRFYRAVEAP